MKSIYKSAKSKSILMELYDEKLESLQFDLEEIDVNRSLGRTRVIKTGNENGKTMIVADDDVFFPGTDAINRAKAIFKNFREAHFLKNCKHMPCIDRYPEIQLQVKTWIQQ
jgi:hypothetical protein